MPKVGGKKFPYTPAGKRAASVARKKKKQTKLTSAKPYGG
jgi:hypothetical protein